MTAAIAGGAVLIAALAIAFTWWVLRDDEDAGQVFASGWAPEVHHEEYQFTGRAAPASTTAGAWQPRTTEPAHPADEWAYMRDSGTHYAAGDCWCGETHPNAAEQRRTIANTSGAGMVAGESPARLSEVHETPAPEPEDVPGPAALSAGDEAGAAPDAADGETAEPAAPEPTPHQAAAAAMAAIRALPTGDYLAGLAGYEHKTEWFAKLTPEDIERMDAERAGVA